MKRWENPNKWFEGEGGKCTKNRLDLSNFCWQNLGVAPKLGDVGGEKLNAN